MKISNREKGLAIVFLIVAVIIFMPTKNNTTTLTNSAKLTPKYKRVLLRFNKIHNLQHFNKNNENNLDTDILRDIFKFGQKETIEPTQTQTLEEQNKLKLLEDKNKAIEENIIDETPKLPEIDFKIDGLIRTKTGNAVIISKSPEIFVIRENKVFFEKFIFKKINTDNVILGFIGFENEKIIPIEDGGGLK